MQNLSTNFTFGSMNPCFILMKSVPFPLVRIPTSNPCLSFDDKSKLTVCKLKLTNLSSKETFVHNYHFHSTIFYQLHNLNPSYLPLRKPSHCEHSALFLKTIYIETKGNWVFFVLITWIFLRISWFSIKSVQSDVSFIFVFDANPFIINVISAWTLLNHFLTASLSFFLTWQVFIPRFLLFDHLPLPSPSPIAYLHLKHTFILKIVY